MEHNCLGWQWLSGKDTQFLQKSPGQSGYDIYAPVMYKVDSAALEVIVDFSSNIALARQQGYRVWLTYQQFGTNPNLSETMIDAIISKAREYAVDGINIDFEGMGEVNRDRFTEFVQKLSRQTECHNLVLSVDVVRPAVSMYSLCYDRRALAQVCDYLILMAYDQHWATSPLEGSVADLPWTEESITKLLDDEGVPPEKLILGVPFYSRNWKIQTFLCKDTVILRGAVNLRSGPSTQHPVLYTGTKDEVFTCRGEVSGEAISGNLTWYQLKHRGMSAYVSAAYSTRLPDGETRRVSSTAIGLQAGLDIVSNYNAQSKTSRFGSIQMYNVHIADDKKTQQTLVTYNDSDGNLNKIWLEDYHSLAKRQALVKKYKLSGLAAWSLEWMDTNQQAWRELLR